MYPLSSKVEGYKRKYWYFDNESFENKNHKSYHLISLVTPWMFTKQTDGKFEKWVESGLSTFEIWRLVAEIYFNNSVLAQICLLCIALIEVADHRTYTKWLWQRQPSYCFLSKYIDKSGLVGIGSLHWPYSHTDSVNISIRLIGR